MFLLLQSEFPSEYLPAHLYKREYIANVMGQSDKCDPSRRRSFKYAFDKLCASVRWRQEIDACGVLSGAGQDARLQRALAAGSLYW